VCAQLSLACVTKNQKTYKNKKLNQTNASAHQVQYKSKIHEGSPKLSSVLCRELCDLHVGLLFEIDLNSTTDG